MEIFLDRSSTGPVLKMPYGAYKMTSDGAQLQAYPTGNLLRSGTLRSHWTVHFSGNCVLAVKKVNELSYRAFPLKSSTAYTTAKVELWSTMRARRRLQTFAPDALTHDVYIYLLNIIVQQNLVRIDAVHGFGCCFLAVYRKIGA